MIYVYKESQTERKVITLILQSSAPCTKIDNMLPFTCVQRLTVTKTLKYKI